MNEVYEEQLEKVRSSFVNLRLESNSRIKTLEAEIKKRRHTIGQLSSEVARLRGGVMGMVQPRNSVAALDHWDLARTQRELNAVFDERGRQEAAWGMQLHPPQQYVHILNEEFLEAQTEIAKTVNDFVFRPPGHPVTVENFRKLHEELKQTAAVAVAMMEVISRGLESGGVAVANDETSVCAFCLTKVFTVDTKEVQLGMLRVVRVCKLHDSFVVLSELWQSESELRQSEGEDSEHA